MIHEGWVELGEASCEGVAYCEGVLGPLWVAQMLEACKHWKS